MTQRLGSQAIVVNTTQIFNTPSSGLKGLIIDNASPFVLTVNLQGSSLTKTLQPAGTDFFEVYSGFNGNVVYSSQAQITNPQSYTNFMISIDAVGVGESVDISQFPVARPMPAVTATASGQPIFSATVGFGSTAGNHQSLNLYNPANSGVSYQLHSARFFTTITATGAHIDLLFSSGADNNLPIPVPAVSHDCAQVQPVSTAHCTASDDNNGPGGLSLETVNCQPNVTLDFLTFPDQVIVRPGNNIRIATGNSATGLVLRFTLKWTEVPQISNTDNTGGATTGNILTAANVVNSGNPAGTGVIAASPSGDGTNALYADNAGNFIIGDLSNNGDLQVVSAALGGTFFHVRGLDGTILFDGAQPLPGDSFTFHSQSGANQLKVTDAGAEFFNQAKLDAGAKLAVGSISQINTFTVAVTTTPTAHAHGLTVAPTGFSYIFTGTGNTAGSLQVSSIGATNITLTASGSFTAIVTVYAL